MKVEGAGFLPITVTLETQEEVDALFHLTNFLEQDKLAGYLENGLYTTTVRAINHFRLGLHELLKEQGIEVK